LTTEIDLANPISLKEITRAATQDLEREIILRVLQANGWNRSKTAKWLQISYRSLLYKLQEFHIESLPGRDHGARHVDATLGRSNGIVEPVFETPATQERREPNALVN